MDIHLHLERGRSAAAKLTLDGVDITNSTAAQGVHLDLSDSDRPLVTVTLIPKTLTVSGDMLVKFDHRLGDDILAKLAEKADDERNVPPTYGEIVAQDV